MRGDALTGRLRGVLIPAVTPFTPDGALDLASFEANLERWGRTAVRGYLVLGSNGEFRSLDDDESLAVVRVAAANVADKTLVVGAGRESLRLTLAFVERLAQVPGVDAVALLTPHYFARAMSDEALVGYYREVADRSPLPVVLYVAPAFANGVVLSPDAAAELAHHPNVCGVKDSDPDRLRAYLASAHDDFAVLAGSISSLLTCLTLGGDGGIVSAANYLPDECARVAELAFAGRLEEAASLHAALEDVVRRTGSTLGVAGVKACMNLLGYAAGVPRLPLLPAPPDATDEFRRFLESAVRGWAGGS